MTFNIFYFSFLILILTLSFFVIKEDLKYKKIKNKWLIFCFLLGLLLFFIFYLFGRVNFDYLSKVVINTLISLTVGFIIWKFKFWSAGDSKFFTLISFLLPLHFYQKTYLAYFPSFVLLTNIFFLFLAFLFFKSLILFPSFIKKEGFPSLWKNFISKKIKKLFFQLIVGVLVYFIISQLILSGGGLYYLYLILIFLTIKFFLDFYTEIEVSKIVPFAIWVFLGAVLTVLAKGNIISLIR